MAYRWTKGALKAPTESGPQSKARGRTERLKRQAFERHFVRHEGLAPVRLARLENRIGPFSGGAFVAGQSQRSACLSPVLGGDSNEDGQGSPFLRDQARGPEVGQTTPKASAIEKRRQPFTCSTGRGLRNEDRRHDRQPEADTAENGNSQPPPRPELVTGGPPTRCARKFRPPPSWPGLSRPSTRLRRCWR